MTEDKLLGPLNGLTVLTGNILMGYMVPFCLLFVLVLAVVLFFKAESNAIAMRIERERTEKTDWDAEVAPHNEDLPTCKCGPWIRLFYW